MPFNSTTDRNMNAGPPNPEAEWFASTKPTRMTVFLRTFLPYQLWRFLRINLKMFSIIRKGHQFDKR